MPDDTRAPTTAEPLLTRIPPPEGPPTGRALVPPALCVDFAPQAATRAVTATLPSPSLTEAVVDGAALDTTADPFRWARQPDAVVTRIAEWVQKTGAAS